MSGEVPLTLVPREEPLSPVGVMAFGAVARALARRVLEGDLGTLEGVAGDDAIVLLGEEASLPFVDGVIYLGAEDGMSSVLLPTTHRTNVPMSLVDALLREQGIDLPAALVVYDGALEIVPTREARKLVRAKLEEFARAAEET